ncbi:MAG: hypothetical protein HEQ23_13930 [Tepidisphaera sp.]
MNSPLDKPRSLPEPLCGAPALFTLETHDGRLIIKPEGRVSRAPLVAAVLLAACACVQVWLQGSVVLTRAGFGASTIIVLLLACGCVTSVCVWAFRRSQQDHAIRSGARIEVCLEDGWVCGRADQDRKPISSPPTFAVGERRIGGSHGLDQVQAEVTLEIKLEEGRWAVLLQEPWPGSNIKHLARRLMSVPRAILIAK